MAGSAPEKTLHADQDREALLLRLRRIEGQVRGVQKMVAEGRYCLDILAQLQAITAATNRAAEQLLEGHIRGCVTEAIREQRGEETIDELLHVLNRAITR